MCPILDTNYWHQGAQPTKYSQLCHLLGLSRQAFGMDSSMKWILPFFIICGATVFTEYLGPRVQAGIRGDVFWEWNGARHSHRRPTQHIRSLIPMFFVSGSLQSHDPPARYKLGSSLFFFCLCLSLTLPLICSSPAQLSVMGASYVFQGSLNVWGALSQESEQLLFNPLDPTQPSGSQSSFLW